MTAPVGGSFGVPATACSHRGLTVTIVGPDGVGKSTLRSALSDLFAEAHPVLSDRSDGPVQSLRSNRGDGRTELFSVPMSVVKLLYLWSDEWLRWVSTTRRVVRSGGVVVSERGWWDVAVFPTRYRMRPTPRLHRLASRLVPLPDLLLVLEAPPETIHERKTELSTSEIDRQAAQWHSIPSSRQAVRFIDAGMSIDDVVSEACDAIADALTQPCVTIDSRSDRRAT